MAFRDVSWKVWEPRFSKDFLFYLEPAGPPSYLVTTASRPNFQLEPVVIDHMNLKRKFAGKGDWQDIELTLNDPVSPEGTAQIYSWLREHHDAESGTNGRPSQYKRQLRLDLLTGEGEVVETWVLYGAFLNNVNWGSTQLDWSSSEPLRFTIGLTYDWAKLEQAGLVT